MRRRPNSLRLILASALGLLVLLVATTSMVRREREEDPAPSYVLNQIGEKNRRAAMEAAAAFKAEAAASRRATELNAPAGEATGMGGPLEELPE